MLLVLTGCISGSLLHLFYQLAHEYIAVLPGLRSDHMLQATLLQTQHLRSLAPPVSQLQLWVHTFASELLSVQGVPAFLKQTLFSISASAQTLLLRLLLLIPAVPASVIIFSAVITEALLQREKRRLRGGRESGFVYHRLQKVRLAVFYLPFFLWFFNPFVLPSSTVLLPILPVAVYLWASMVLFKRNV